VFSVTAAVYVFPEEIQSKIGDGKEIANQSEIRVGLRWDVHAPRAWIRSLSISTLQELSRRIARPAVTRNGSL